MAPAGASGGAAARASARVTGSSTKRIPAPPQPYRGLRKAPPQRVKAWPKSSTLVHSGGIRRPEASNAFWLAALSRQRRTKSLGFDNGTGGKFGQEILVARFPQGGGQPAVDPRDLNPFDRGPNPRLRPSSPGPPSSKSGTHDYGCSLGFEAQGGSSKWAVFGPEQRAVGCLAPPVRNEDQQRRPGSNHRRIFPPRGEPGQLSPVVSAAAASRTGLTSVACSPLSLFDWEALALCGCPRTNEAPRDLVRDPRRRS